MRICFMYMVSKQASHKHVKMLLRMYFSPRISFAPDAQTRYCNLIPL